MWAFSREYCHFQHWPMLHCCSMSVRRSSIRSVFAAHLDRPALDVSPSDLQLCVDVYPAPVSAARAVGYVRPLLRRAGKRELVQRGFHELERPIELRQQRVLSRDELKLILPHLDDEYGRAARFLLLTAARLREATEARWSEFDLDAGTWTIVAQRRKDTRSVSPRNGGPTKSLTIPLSRQAREIVHAIPKAEA
jgi:integrase